MTGVSITDSRAEPVTDHERQTENPSSYLGTSGVPEIPERQTLRKNRIENREFDPFSSGHLANPTLSPGEQRISPVRTPL